MSAAPESTAPDWRALLRAPAAGVNVLAALALLAALWAARAFVVPVFTSVLLAVLLWPLLRCTEAVLRSRLASALLVMAVATASAAALGMVAVTQIGVGADHLPVALRHAAHDVASIARDRGGSAAATVQRTRSALEELDRSVAQATGTPHAASQGRAAPGPREASLVQRVVDWASGVAMLAGRAALGLLVELGVIVLLTFFLLLTGDRLARQLSAWGDGRTLARHRVSPLMCDLAREIRRFGGVTAVTNIAIAAAVAAVFLAFGVEQAWMWGLVAGTLHVVPYAGLLVAVGLAAVEVYAVQASPAAALLAAALVAAIGVVIGSGVATWLQGRAARIDGAVMFGGTVASSVLWGGWGLLLGPVLVLAARVVWHHAARHPSASGSCASMRVPAPGVDATLSMPPTASTR